MTSSLKPQAQNFSACKRKFNVSSMNLSCVCKCWGVRKVPLVQMTGCNCFIRIAEFARVFPRLPTITIIQQGSKGNPDRSTGATLINALDSGANAITARQCGGVVVHSRLGVDELLLRTKRRFQQSVHKLQPFFVQHASFKRVAGKDSQAEIPAGPAQHHLDFVAHFLWN